MEFEQNKLEYEKKLKQLEIGIKLKQVLINIFMDIYIVDNIFIWN